MQHTLIALMHDRPGALNRMISLFRRRAFTIHSLSLASTERRGVSRLTLLVERDEVRQVVVQIEQLIDVISVTDVTHLPALSHELCLVRVGTTPGCLGELLRLAHRCDARVADVSDTGVLLVVNGTPDAVSGALERFAPYGIEALTRSGPIAMSLDCPRTTARGRSGEPEHYTWQADGAIEPEAA